MSTSPEHEQTLLDHSAIRTEEAIAAITRRAARLLVEQGATSFSSNLREPGAPYLWHPVTQHRGIQVLLLESCDFEDGLRVTAELCRNNTPSDQIANRSRRFTITEHGWAFDGDGLLEPNDGYYPDRSPDGKDPDSNSSLRYAQSFRHALSAAAVVGRSVKALRHATGLRDDYAMLNALTQARVEANHWCTIAKESKMGEAVWYKYPAPGLAQLQTP